MASAFSIPPAALHNKESNSSPTHTFPDAREQHPTTNSAGSSHLSPALSRFNSDSLSPSFNNETPGDSNSSLSHYQSSDFSDLDEDPFFGADFSNVEGGTPSFLDHAVGLDQPLFPVAVPEANQGYHVNNGNTYPLTPENTISTQAASPQSVQRVLTTRSTPDFPASISPQELQKPFKPISLMTGTAQLTPSQSSSGRSSEDSLAPIPPNVACHSPRVTVSMWGKDSDHPVHTVERSFDEDSSATMHGGIDVAGDLISPTKDDAPTSAPRDRTGRWRRNPLTGHAGLEPGRRPSDDVSSINEIISRHEITERNQEVDKWLTEETENASIPPETSPEDIKAMERPGANSNDNIPLGDQTENRHVPGQTYYASNGGNMTQDDYDIIASDRNWGDAPAVHPISKGTPGRHQPQSSQAAIERFERLCRDNDSILSRAATWGTRRRSLHSIMDIDAEVAKSGNLLKKLSLSKGDKGTKQGGGGIFKDLRGLVRRPSASQLLKRTRSTQDEESLPGSDSRGSQDTKHDSIPHLAPPARTSSWSKKPMPSINTAIVSMGSNFASIGTTHARSGSISTASVTSPKTPFGGLTVRNTLTRRPRSKSELPRPAAADAETHPNLVSMWKQSGGPPVASLAKTNSAEMDEEDEEDEDGYDDNDLKPNANLIDEINPTFAGFQQHILTLNPGLSGPGHYLVDRIAHQQVVRYKQLLNCKVKHLSLGANCPSGTLCVALGGTANVLDSKGDSQELDPLVSHHDDDDDTPAEGIINQDSFPPDIPMPPTQQLPAELECQLCFQHKKFQKPSDWTKHVHEDVQPFTCTWDKCRDPKIFKRKADWVRHENEGHRHLEWWTCDVEDCRHTCYRRDNFLQHLVREHKFPEPKVKTKAAIKKSGGSEPAWQKVERCHVETPARPQDEPCRFCGKVLPTWKKLTVHLAKHMEQISLPVLRLVAAKAKELAADTIISPVQDPPRQMFPLAVNPSSPMAPYPSGAPQQQMTPNPQPVNYQDPGQFAYPNLPTGPFPQQSFYNAPYNNVGQNVGSTPAMTHSMTQVYNQTHQMRDMPATTAPYMQSQNLYLTMPTNGMEAFPSLNANALGLQNHGANSLDGQMAYDGFIGPSSGNGSPFSGQESASPYSRSPNPNAGNAEAMWDNKQMTGFF